MSVRTTRPVFPPLGMSVVLCCATHLRGAEEVIPSVPPPIQHLFERLDIDPSGRLGLEEFTAHPGQVPAGQRRDFFDGDSDGELNLAEFWSITNLLPGIPRGPFN